MKPSGHNNSWSGQRKGTSNNQNQSWQDDNALEADNDEFFINSFKIQSSYEGPAIMKDLSHDTSPANPTSSTSTTGQDMDAMNKRSPIVLGLSKGNKQSTADKLSKQKEKSAAENSKTGLQKPSTPSTSAAFTSRTTAASCFNKSFAGKRIESRITRSTNEAQAKPPPPQQYLFLVPRVQPQLPRAQMPKPPKVQELPGGFGFSYPKGIPKSFLLGPQPQSQLNIFQTANNQKQQLPVNMPVTSQPEPNWQQNVPQGTPVWSNGPEFSNPIIDDQELEDTSGDMRAYSPSDLYMENTLNEEFNDEDDLDFLDSQTGQKRLSAFERLGPLTQPKKPKLTINLLWNKEESVREVVDESTEEAEKKYTPVHLRKDVLESEDQTVKKYIKFWPWKKEVKLLKSVTRRTSRTVMLVEKEQMLEIYYQSGTWFQISATGYPPSCTKDMVLDAILEVVKGKSFIPCFIEFTAEECKFLVLRCHLALKVLHNVGFFVRKGEVDISITISQTNLSLNNLDFKPKLVLRNKLLTVFDAETSLDLSNFTTDEVSSHFIYFPLHDTTNQDQLMFLQSNIPWKNLTVLNLSQNKLTSLSGFDLAKRIPKLRHLDLSRNYLEKSVVLLPCRNMDLHSIRLEGNPLCLDFIDPRRYVKVLRTMFPMLKEIDGVPIQQKGDMPQIKRNYCTSDGEGVIGRFLDVYFPLIDSEDENRKSLVNLYDMKACMTITYRYKMRQGPIFRLCRSLFAGSRLMEEGDVDSVDGAVNISKVINKCPLMKHDPNTFTVDQLYHNEQDFVTIFKVNGLLKLKEESLEEDENLVAFGRTFVLHSYDGADYRIVNEMVYWDTPNAKLAGTAFQGTADEPRELSLVLESPPDEDLKDNLIKIFMKLTDMDEEGSQRCLEQWNWNLKIALVDFMIILKSDELNTLTAEVME